MSKSSEYLDFSNPELEAFEYKVNNKFDVEKYNGKVNFGTNTTLQPLKDEPLKMLVRLVVNINDGEKNAPFHINAIISSIFTFSPELEDDVVIDMLRVNGSALLFSYIRPIVSSITSIGPNKSFNIPFMDFTQSSMKNDK